MTDTFDKSMGLTKRQKYGILHQSLLNERYTFDAHWKDLAQFVQPRRTRWFVSDRNKGDRRNQKIIDSTASLALRTLRSGMHAGMTSPARPWQRISLPDGDLAKYGPVKEWLHTVNQRMLDVYLKSNIYNSFPVLYGDAGLFATGAMAVLEDSDSVIRTHCYPIGSYALGMNYKGKVDTFVREYEMTVFQLVEDFGADPDTNTINWKNISITVHNAWDRGNYQQAVTVVWVVMPNTDYDKDKLTSRYKKFASCWYEKGSTDGKFLRESGYNEFPIIAVRWDVTGEDTYGTDCPGMTTLGSIKGLQMGKKLGAQALEKMVNPPLQAPVELKSQSISMIPGAVSFVADGTGRQGIRSLHDVNLALDQLEAWNQQDREQINSGFMVNFFLSLINAEREMTAYEAEQRAQERALILGPTFERFTDEVYDPLVDRVYPIMERAGLIPPPPQEIPEGASLVIQYTSIMAQAQRLAGIVGLDRILTTTVNASQVFPAAVHKINIMEAIDEYADILDINPRVIVDSEAAAESYAQQQKMVAQQHAADLAAQGAKAAKDLGNTPMNDNTALSQIVQGIRGAA